MAVTANPLTRPLPRPFPEAELKRSLTPDHFSPPLPRRLSPIQVRHLIRHRHCPLKPKSHLSGELDLARALFRVWFGVEGAGHKPLCWEKK